MPEDFFPSPHINTSFTQFKVRGVRIIKFNKKGSIAKSKEGALLLVNEDKKAYKVDEIVILIWTMCDGKHDSKEIVEEFCSKLGKKVPKEEIEKAVSDITQQLEKFGLLEKCK